MRLTANEKGGKYVKRGDERIITSKRDEIESKFVEKQCERSIRVSADDAPQVKPIFNIMNLK